MTHFHQQRTIFAPKLWCICTNKAIYLHQNYDIFATKMRQYYNIFVCTTVASIFPNCVLATSVMGVLILSHPMSLYNYYINIIISSSSSSHYHQEHHIITIIIHHKKNDCRVKPHTEQTAYDDDISNSIDVQIL